MSELPEDDPAQLVRTLAASLRFARWTGADVVDRAWARPIELPPEPQIVAPPPQPVAPPRPVPAPQPQPRVTAPLPIAAAVEPHVALQRLQTRIAGCERCSHAQSRTQIVFGQGSPKARVMIVGDAPGALEDAAGQPFQGDAGALLDKMLAAIGLARGDVWLTTIALCRPAADGVVGNAAIAACSPYLRTQMEAIRPEAVLLMGEAATQFLLKQATPLAELRGRWARVLDRPTLPTWAPEALLADPAKKREAWADLQLLQKALQAR